MSRNGGDGQVFTGVSNAGISAPTAAFTLLGGKYAVCANATGTGTMGLQRLGADGTTWIAAHTVFSAVTGFAVLDLPPGQYRFFVATFTAVFAEVTGIPQ